MIQKLFPLFLVWLAVSLHAGQPDAAAPNDGFQDLPSKKAALTLKRARLLYKREKIETALDEFQVHKSSLLPALEELIMHNIGGEGSELDDDISTFISKKTKELTEEGTKLLRARNEIAAQIEEAEVQLACLLSAESYEPPKPEKLESDKSYRLIEVLGLALSVVSNKGYVESDGQAQDSTKQIREALTRFHDGLRDIVGVPWIKKVKRGALEDNFQSILHDLRQWQHVQEKDPNVDKRLEPLLNLLDFLVTDDRPFASQHPKDGDISEEEDSSSSGEDVPGGDDESDDEVNQEDDAFVAPPEDSTSFLDKQPESGDFVIEVDDSDFSPDDGETAPGAGYLTSYLPAFIQNLLSGRR